MIVNQELIDYHNLELLEFYHNDDIVLCSIPNDIERVMCIDKHENFIYFKTIYVNSSYNNDILDLFLLYKHPNIDSFEFYVKITYHDNIVSNIFNFMQSNSTLLSCNITTYLIIIEDTDLQDNIYIHMKDIRSIINIDVFIDQYNTSAVDPIVNIYKLYIDQ